MRKLVLLVALLLAGNSFAQQVVLPQVTQTGSVTANHLAVWSANQILKDGGSTAIVTSGSITAAGFIPTGSTVVANGLYLPAANSIGFSTNTTAVGSVDATGHWRIGKTQSPTIASGACGTTTNGTITSGNDQSFVVTIGSAATTSCAVSFASTYATAPRSCIITAGNAAAIAATTLAYVNPSNTTTTGMTITGAVLASTTWNVQCM